MAKKEHSILMSPVKLMVLTVASLSALISCIASPLGKQSAVCETPECFEAAQLVLKRMDRTINPCDDFHKFACGKFTKETVIPEDKIGVSFFTQTEDLLQAQLKHSIEGQLQKNDPKVFQLVQSIYKVCTDTENIEKTGTREIQSILSSLGGWPVVVGKSWTESYFNWQKLIYQLRNIGHINAMNSLVNLNIAIDEKNSERRIITLDQATTGLSQEYLSNGTENEVVKAYFQYQVDVAVILGANRQQAQKDLTESLNFEIELAKIFLAPEKRQNESEIYNLMTVAQLQSKYPFVTWIEYLNNILSPHGKIKLTDKVNVRVPNFLESLPKLLLKTPKRVLANYMIGRVVQESADFVNKVVRDAKANYTSSIYGMKVEPARHTFCIDYLSFNVPVAISALYVRQNFDKTTKIHIEILVKKLRQSLDSMIEKLDWMDEKTKTAARLKLNAVQQYVAYPGEFFDDEKLNKYFEGLKIDQSNSFLKNNLQKNLFDWENLINNLVKPVDKNDWISHGISAVVNSYYDSTENSIMIPAGILNGEFFKSTRPNYMNYGSIGYIIGHELTHAFDNEGSQFDENGNLVDWWDDNTKQEYLNRARCIIDQYSNYTVEEIGLKINGGNTQGENIADNGGINDAYNAYVNYEKEHGEEPRLPGLPYSPRQMFWISAANTWCDKFRPQILKDLAITGVHISGKYRVIGPFSNMPEFSRDFQCPVGSPMHPVKKCSFW